MRVESFPDLNPPQVQGEESEEIPSSPEAGDSDLAVKVARVLKMFNASDLDDIIKVVPISSMRKIKSKTKGIMKLFCQSKL